ncbi:phospholipid-transporting ATPase IIA [Chondrus crispus]|uniref:Phospholipid-transporting ATPase n=1 Tax=Chondrus crispus TaxID=2769 RepID=R7Q823_CHOCR|nr:phospholipid-transporting ATPase IIA [Chondrus crispus]CDF33958.1 phospholipid-transporting ATPase IIA [Chondrus crispus]|eukprot:XP_005713777.1 phospholipid-transporting ATPase IIA [Chondrus crispus]
MSAAQDTLPLFTLDGGPPSPRPHSLPSSFLRLARGSLPLWLLSYLPLSPQGAAPAEPETLSLESRVVPLGACAFADGVVQRGRWIRNVDAALAGVEGARGGNAVCNQKYNFLSFLPLVLYEQFRMFYNLFFLLVACSQFIPALRVGFFWTYFGPLVFVLLVSVSKEAFDDLARFQRDRKLNMFAYSLLLPDENGSAHTVRIPSQDIRVGDVLILDTDERVPADCVLLRVVCPEDDHSPAVKDRTDAAPSAGQGDTLFIRTDQLDGETDWKLRRAVAGSQSFMRDEDMLYSHYQIEAEAPKKEIYDFVGTFVDPNDPSGNKEPLTLENTLWANTVVASGRAICVVMYNGDETRSMLNTSSPRSKIGKLDLEVNRMSKMLFFLLFSLSALLTGLRGFSGQWILYFCRYFLLLSAIIPISMRVNLDMAKIAYTTFIENDSEKMPGCTVRNSNLPEELGRIEYILTDKTGTLTQNEMSFKKLHLGTMLFARDSLEDIYQYAKAAFQHDAADRANTEWNETTADNRMVPMTSDNISRSSSGYGYGRDVVKGRRTHKQIQEALLAIALAHNVTPVEDAGQRTLQAASPDEVALVTFAESVGIILKERSMSRVILKVPGNLELRYDILAEFPFTSAAKRMGIIVKERHTNVITLFVKGADTTMAKKVRYNDWLDEECGNLAREGLRTLVYAKRELSIADYELFADRWQTARTSSINRKEYMATVQEEIEQDMVLLALTGVEDKLQPNVRESLEKLRHAGIRIWMLTGDKVETATNIAVSSRLAERSQGIFTITGMTGRNEASRALARFRRVASTDVLVVDGTSLQIYLDMFPEQFIELAAMAPAAVACRCSPTQKAAVVQLLQTQLNKRVAAIGDGGNDVGMIQQAHAGIGIPGKEGMQASLAADFSITSFSHLTRLLLWHGRNSYRRSARLAQFVIHRGLIISIIQTVYCALFFYAAVSVYSGWILVGYATVFTMFPVFSLILDEDVNEHAADTYPELYKDLQKGRSLNLKTFLIWVFKSIYQGTMIMVFSVYVLWDDEYFTTLHLSAISFTSLILTELLMVAFEVHRWHWMMIAAEACSLLCYVASIFILQDTFDHSLIFQWGFLGRVIAVTLVSCVPVTIGKWLKRKFAPAPYSKLA